MAKYKSWSRLKKEVESRFAKSVAGRISLFMTGYRDTHNEAGRWSVLIDGVEIGGVGDFNSWQINHALADPDVSLEEGYAVLRSKGLHERSMVVESLSQYLNLPIEDALASPDALIRSMAVLDHRTGKARLRKLRTSHVADPLEKRCLEFRCEVEGIDKVEQKDH